MGVDGMLCTFNNNFSVLIKMSREANISLDDAILKADLII